MEQNTQLKGIMPALITPYATGKKASKVNFTAFEDLLTRLRAAGVSGWVPCGSTGEYYSMDEDERTSVLKFVKDFATEDETLIAGTNATTTKDVIRNTQTAKDLGYDAVLLATPFYTRPAEEELIQHFQAVLDATDMNIVLYSYPTKDGVEISFNVIDALADHPRVIGIKESSGVVQRAVDIVSRYDQRVQLVSGSDDVALDFMFWGAKSWICGPANCMAKACCDIQATYDAGDLDKARTQMKTLYKAMSSLESGKFVQKVKYGCELQGIDAGICRQPLLGLTAEEKKEFQTAMQPILDW